MKYDGFVTHAHTHTVELSCESQMNQTILRHHTSTTSSEGLIMVDPSGAQNALAQNTRCFFVWRPVVQWSDPPVMQWGSAISGVKKELHCSYTILHLPMQNKRRQKQESTYHAKQIPVLLLMPCGVSCDRKVLTHPQSRHLSPVIMNRR